MPCVRPPRMWFSAEAPLILSLPQTYGPHLSSCLIPVCASVLGTALGIDMSELSKREEDLQEPGEAHNLEEEQLLGTEAGEAASASASSLPVSCSTLAEALSQEALNEMPVNLMKFLLFKYQAKELTSEAEMLKKDLRDNQKHFPVVFSQASECLKLVCGVEVKEMDPMEHIYIMVSTLGFTCDAMLSSGQGLPKASLLVLFLSLIMWNGDRTPVEEV